MHLLTTHGLLWANDCPTGGELIEAMKKGVPVIRNLDGTRNECTINKKRIRRILSGEPSFLIQIIS